MCDEHGISGDSEYYSDNDAHLDRTIVFYHGIYGGKYGHVRCSSTSSPA
jgi:hypothetical protein